ncbi:MAG TPA: hypothetical protein VN636_05470, partial [Acidimicrobiia bacterium]|nr:hypothetical protein [Acidimicrobiia bacterium]
MMRRSEHCVLVASSGVPGTEPEFDDMSRSKPNARVRRRGLAACAGGVALAAFAGAIGAAAGLDLVSTRFRRRLPYRSPVLGAGALVVVVAVPSALTARYAWRGDERADAAAITAG